jgi:flagellar M-ring protein FliF
MSQVAQWMARVPSFSDIAKWSRPVQLGVASGIVALIVVAAMWLQAPSYKVLFSNVEDRDGGAIVNALTALKVPYKLGDTGNTILVPADRVHEARLQLAQQGLPRNGHAGFELLDQNRFGASQFAEQVNYQRALEGELANSVKSLNAVQDARVHLALPRESLFVRDRQPPTASVLVNLYPGRTLSESQVSAISWLVSSSVPHLTADHVSVVDQNGRMLSLPAGEAGMENTRRDLINDIEQRTMQRILTLLTPLVGSGNVRAQVSADVDFSQREQTSEVYRPNQKPGQAAVRSEQTSSSMQNGVDPAQGIPGALTNQPPANPVAPITTQGTQGQQNTAQGQQRANPGNAANAANAGNTATAVNGSQTGTNRVAGTSRNDATINYEVDRTISHTKDPVGSLRRLSVAVVVNYRTVDGKQEPLDPTEMEKLNQLVREAMGYSADRGDSISVVNSPFSPEPTVPVWQNPVYLDYAVQLFKSLVIAFAVYLVWRLILRRIVMESQAAAARREAELAQEKEAREHAETAARLAAEMSRYEDNLTAARELATKDPRAVAMVLRAWMEKKDGSSPST